MPVLDHDRVRDFADTLRRTGRRVVLTHGVYDLLHPGHIRYLQAARDQGDALIVAVNSDRSARGVAGRSRPVTPAEERAEIVAALDSVDAAVIFDDSTPDALIALIQPDTLVEGAGWPADEAVGPVPVEAPGPHVVSIPVEPGWSTSLIIDSIQRNSKP